MFDKNSDEIWADLIIQEERETEVDQKSEFLFPILGNIDDIAKSPLECQDSFSNALQSRSLDRSFLLSNSREKAHLKVPTPSTSRKKIRANPEQSRKMRWTSEEDQIVMDLYRERGANWKLISNELHGRAADAIKSRFYGTLKKRMNVEQKRLLNNRINQDCPIENDLPNSYEPEETFSSVSTDPIVSESFVLSESTGQLTAEDKRRKVQELHSKMIALQAIISKTQQEISNMKEI